MEPAAEGDESPPRKLQFSLRSLVITMIFCGLLLGRYGIRRHEAAQEKDALIELQSLGADVQLHEERVVGVSFSGPGPPAKFLELLNRLPRLQRLVLIDTHLTDAGLGKISEQGSLEQLLLLGANITDNGLAHLAQLTELKTLRLDNTQIGDEGLKHVRRLGRLERLDLVGTRVTDAGLEHLAGLAQLRQLYLNGTAVTEEGVNRLQERLPEAKIVR
jgi:hypothetical protein